VNLIEKFVLVDQAPIGRTPRSSPVTYSGAWDEIRRVFAATREAKRRGFKASRFSFNTPGGRCEACAGQGRMKIEMNFLPDLFVPCNECGGKRFDRAMLQIRFREKSIADVLEMPAEEAAAFFENFESIHRVLASLVDVGLGYLPIGQPSTTLSGGEAQRVKLGTELARVDAGNTLYLLDEPTTGLHLADIARLMNVLQRLVDRGNTVIVIEHHADVIAAADWVIELGPGGGENGGRVVFEGEGRGARG
jgi:excinuclease ABC subunit A